MKFEQRKQLPKGDVFERTDIMDANISANAQIHGYVTVTISRRGVGMSFDLPPEVARDFATSIIEVAEFVEKD